MKTKERANVDKVIQANFGKKSYVEIGKMTGLNPEAVRSRARRMGLTQGKQKLSVEKQVEVDILETKSSRKLKETSQKYSYIIKRNEELEKLVDVLNAPREYQQGKIVTVKSGEQSGNRCCFIVRLAY